MSISALRQRLEASRRALLEAVRGLTEQAFASELPPSASERATDSGSTTVVAYLAALAPAEREAVRLAREAVGAEQRPLPQATAREQVLPPQLIHDLAGARYETLLFLDALAEDALAEDALEEPQLRAESGEHSVQELLEAVAERESAAARRLAERPTDD